MANQILAGAVFHAGQVIAGVDANNPPYVGPPVGKWVTRSNTYPRSIFIRSVLDIDADPVTIENSTTSHFGGNAVSDPNGNYLAINDHVNDKVFIYDTQDLSAAPTVITPQPIDNGMFGHSMCMTNDKIFVGQNPVYAYDLSDLSAAPNTISAPTSEVAAHGFGSDLACNSTHLFIGSKHARINQTGGVDTSGVNSESGKVHAWNLATEQYETDLYGIDPEYGDMFGSEIRVTDTHVAIGAYGADSSPGYQPETGAVYLFDAQDLSATPTKLTGGGYSDGFGQTIDLNDTHLAVSEARNSDNQNENGKLFIYPLNNTSSPIVATGTLYSERFGSNPILFNDGSNRISFYRSFANLGQPASYFVYDINDLSTPLWQEEVVTERPILMMSPYVAPPPPPPSYMAVGARSGSYAYVYDANDLSATPTKLTPPNGSIANENFGQSIVSNANNIFVSAPEYGTTHSQEGVIYAYNINDLSAAPTPLLSGDGHVNKFLGTQLSLSGDRLYAAAYGDNTHGTYSGAVYVYNTNDLSEAPTKLTPIDGAASDFFSGTGGSVAVNSYNLFVGSINDDDRGSNSGSVYVYDVNDLSVQATKITPSDGAAADTFGRSVVANDDYVVISSHGDDNNNVQQDGSIYVYDANNLSATPTKIVSPEGIQYGRFGYVMDMAEGKLAVGTDDRNRVYVYDTDNLSASPTIVTSPDDSYDFFGTTPIRLREGYLLIGQTHDNEREGSVYAYDLNDLSAAPTKLTSPDGSAQDRFGFWIS